MVDIPAACRSWYAQCTLCSRPLGSHGMVLDAAVVQHQVPLLGSRNAWFDEGIHVMRHPGWLLEEFGDFST